MWESICLTLAATAGNNIGKVLQKKGTGILPPLSFKFKVIRAYAVNKSWLIGFLIDISGALLMLRALSLAPVSVIQPVSGCGLAILSIFSHFYLQEVMNVIDWLGITLAGIGTIGVGAGGEEQVASSVSILQLPWLAFFVVILFCPPHDISNHPCFPAYAMFFVPLIIYCGLIHPACFRALYMVIQVLLNGWLRICKRQRREQELMEYEVVEEIIYGLESGILFGTGMCLHGCIKTDGVIVDLDVHFKCSSIFLFRMASVISKIGFVFVQQGFSKMLIPLCVSISICCSGTGFYYQTRGLKHGRAIVISTCAAVASIVTGVLAGMLALGERLPSAPVARLSLLLGWLFIMMGVILLVSSTRLMRHLPWPLQNLITSGADRNFSLRKTGSHRVKDPSPAAVIPAATLHHLIPTPAKEKA
ncbi:putative magnesium transporter NIPA9 [Gossypium australe]|uniref:Probable magnesium transporter n=1 Tax=Gossypium australe TaxID=47621 RepID=A0A5B6UJK7_9ROSI|nr:putative magnesium transporter NIPA9 [Gossypium australe]